MNRKIKTIIYIGLGILFMACQTKQTQSEKIDVQELEQLFRNSIETLASDDFLGRKPFTEGEDLTLAFLEDQFKEIGIAPGNGNSFYQDVPMIEILSRLQEGKVEIASENEKIALSFPDDIVAVTKQAVDEINIEDSPLVFVGFGINAPEYDWNDYEGLDVKGKTVVALINDPGYYNADLFQGKNMTYYGRWMYKYEEAARQGAEGILLIHSTDPASYGWDVVRSTWGGAKLVLEDEKATDFEGWISEAAAEKIFEHARIDLKKLSEEAQKPGFKSVPLETSLSGVIKNQLDRKSTKNVIGMLPGDRLKDEYLIFSAHWDHMGIADAVDGDSIYNGATDNASGTAALLTLAKMFKDHPQTDRTIVFLALTAEEQGIFGSEYYVKNPIYPLNKTVVNINMDVLHPHGKMKDIHIIGKDLSTADKFLEEAAEQEGRYVSEPEDQSRGSFYRSDHFNFAKAGIPVLFIKTGDDSVEHGKEWGQMKKEEYNRTRYHQPQDEYDEYWDDVSGIMEDLILTYRAGTNMANTDEFPTWNEGVMFKKTREESLKE